MSVEDIGIARRLGRAKGRDSRTQTLGTKLTTTEEAELFKASEDEGKCLSEWAREVLLREARRSKGDAVFTEVIGTRILLNNILRALVCGQTMTPEDFEDIQARIRADKRQVAREIMQQYTTPGSKEQ